MGIEKLPRNLTIPLKILEKYESVNKSGRQADVLCSQFFIETRSSHIDNKLFSLKKIKQRRLRPPLIHFGPPNLRDLEEVARHRFCDFRSKNVRLTSYSDSSV